MLIKMKINLTINQENLREKILQMMDQRQQRNSSLREIFHCLIFQIQVLTYSQLIVDGSMTTTVQHKDHLKQKIDDIIAKNKRDIKRLQMNATIDIGKSLSGQSSSRIWANFWMCIVRKNNQSASPVMNNKFEYDAYSGRRKNRKKLRLKGLNAALNLKRGSGMKFRKQSQSK